VRVLLVATYELGHQPVNLARPAARMRARGHDVRVIDTSVEPWQPALVDWADRVAFSVPMHTATRLARELAAGIDKPVCCYGLYAGMCSDVAGTVIAGEYEDALDAWADADPPPASNVQLPTTGHSAPGSVASGKRTSAAFLGRATPRAGGPAPARDLLPGLDRYARLAIHGEHRLVGSVEASRGCAHRCRHCPVPVVYDGRVRVADEAAVLADIDEFVRAGAQHINFGDPDFLNAPRHAMRVVRALHERHPDVTFDCTTKVEHVLEHRSLFGELGASGCVFVVSAFESVNDEILDRLDKGHTAADAALAVRILRDHDIDVRPSFLPFTPWTTRDDVVQLLDFVVDHELVASVDPVQYTIRLLLPTDSLLLALPDLAPHLGPWDAARLTYTWTPADPSMDDLQRELASVVERSIERGDTITETYAAVRAAVGVAPVDLGHVVSDRPHLTESWFCCAEPTDMQLKAVAT
jgi:Radical SAM superfamily